MAFPPSGSVESIVTNARNAIRDADGGQTEAVRESTVTDPCNTIRYGNFLQAIAVIESIDTDTRNAIRNADGGQAEASCESIVSDTRNVISASAIGHGFRNTHLTAVSIRTRSNLHCC